jgi:hypothetical protein
MHPSSCSAAGARRCGGKKGLKGAAAANGQSKRRRKAAAPPTLEALVKMATTPPSDSRARLQLDATFWEQMRAAGSNDEHNTTRLVVDMTLRRLRERSCPVRTLAMDLLDALFRRSCIARAEIVARLSPIMELSVGHDPVHPLPGPPDAAQILRARGLECLESWDASHGSSMPSIRVARRYLEESRAIKFPGAVAAAAAKEAKQVASQQRSRLKAEVLRVKNLVADYLPRIREALVEMNSCFQLATGDIFAEHEEAEQQEVPAVAAGSANSAPSSSAAAAAAAAAEQDGSDIEWEDGEGNEYDDIQETIAIAGLGHLGYTLEVEITPGQESVISSGINAVWDQLEVTGKVVQTQYMPQVEDWTAVLDRAIAVGLSVEGGRSRGPRPGAPISLAASLPELNGLLQDLRAALVRLKSLKAQRQQT